MKIAFITLGFSPYRASGLDLSGERLIQGILEKGHQVSVIAGYRGNIQETSQHPNLRIHRIPIGNSDWIGFGYRAAAKITELEPFDIVHFWDIHFGWSYRRHFVGSLQHSFQQRINSLGSPSLNTSYRWWVKYIYYLTAKYVFETPTINRASGLLAGSKTSCDEFVKEYNLSENRIKIARHGIDTDFFKPIQDTLQWRKKLGIEPGETVILFAGFITPRKGLEYVAQAMPFIQPKPKLLIIGRWRSETYRNKIMMSMQPFLDQVVELGFVEDQDMPYYFSLADVYVSTSLLEGFGLPLGEALACGTPVVAFDSGSVAEVMGPGGVLVPQRDPEALSKEISALLQDESLRLELGAAGKEYVIKEFSLASMVKSTLEAYEQFM